MNFGKLPLAVVAILTGVQLVYGQKTPDPDSLHWSQGLESYQQEDFGAAAIHLQKIIQSGSSPWESAAWLMLARSYLQMEMFDQAHQAAQKLICKYPHGRYAAYAHYTLGQIDFQEERFLATALELLAAAQNTRDDDLNLLTRSKLDRLFEIYLTDDQKDEVLDWTESPQIQGELIAIRQGYRLPVKIGVILPLSGSHGDEGQRLLAGIEQASAETRRHQRVDVEIVSRDSRGEVVEAVRAAKSLIGEENVIALIGDLDGPCSAGIAAVASERGVPLVIPASQDVGLTDVGEAIFQLLPDYRLEGAAAAAYTFDTLKSKRIAVLAPASDEGRQRVQGFLDEITADGGAVETVQWYYEETTNFRRQLDAIARIGVPDSSVTATEPDTMPADTLEQALGDRINPTSNQDDNPINGVDALYVPVQGEEIALLAPQLAAAGFKRTLIGDAMCLDLVGRESVKSYVTDMIFPANYATSLGYDLESDFAHTYQAKKGAWPDRWSLLGWDAFNFLSQGLKDTGKISCKKVADRLSGVRRFTGVREEMVFPSGERVNHSLYILNYQNGKLGQVKSPQQVAQELLHDH